ncbi:hypothetical protein M422DRAFT_181782 [Sphaerobolus stellatus SS14]|uniref:ATP-dependent DNA helicase n=1 Tax=Sphaerobolus stellatus (strain SS14) TaxID=990650 RepID=A0A0C9VBE2_SPHS4|nr:hypothetical protein M422DRAFT_181782 [Sphaerobolus stellatus SS14]
MRKLREVFKLDSFRPNQLEAILATLSGKDVFVLMPTGGGKSLCYQLPGVCEDGTSRGVTIVVSPLIALMVDQVQHLLRKGVDAILFNSDQGQDVSREARSRLMSRGSKPKLVYVTPEKLHRSEDFRSILARLYTNGELARFVIDEAHCVSTWGRDFRESYQDLDRLRVQYPKTPIMALTATANEQVMMDVIDRLGIQGCTLLKQSFNRPNLFYDVRPKSPKTVLQEIYDFINQKHRGQTGIIYCLSRNKCEEVAKTLREQYKLRARHYHAHLSVEDKNRTQASWQSGECQIIVATIAFGMGIDIRFVIHHSLPKSLDAYYQETGRAGRDGQPATCLLFYTYADTKILFKLIQESETSSAEEKKRQEDAVRAVVQYCSNESDCRRVQVLRHFNQAFDSKDCRKRCNNCADGATYIEEDATEMAAKAIKLVREILALDTSVTKLHCLDVFRGANIKTIRDKNHDRISLFGAGSSLSREQGERIFNHLLWVGAFREVTVANRAGWNTMYLQV